MSEKVLGCIRVQRPAFYRVIYEVLAITPDRVLVARMKGKLGAAFTVALVCAVLGGILGGIVGGVVGAVVGFAIGTVVDKVRKKKKEPSTLEELLKADKKSYAILNSKITKVEVNKSRTGVKLNIITSKGKYKWTALGLDVKKKDVEKDVKLEDYESMLRPVFGDKLSVE